MLYSSQKTDIGMLYVCCFTSGNENFSVVQIYLLFILMCWCNRNDRANLQKEMFLKSRIHRAFFWLSPVSDRSFSGWNSHIMAGLFLPRICNRYCICRNSSDRPDDHIRPLIRRAEQRLIGHHSTKLSWKPTSEREGMKAKSFPIFQK